MPELAGLTWRQAEQALLSASLALVPVGSLEQHGPHLTLDTDLAIAEALARRLASDLGEAAVLCPPLPYGLSEHHMAFPGTITLRPDTFTAVIADLVESLATWGVRRVLVVNGHGGNIDALRLASREARRDQGSLLAAVMWARLASAEISDRAESGLYGHACEIETSVAMSLVPDRVHPELISPPGRRSSVDPFTDPGAGLVDQAVWTQEWTDDGALGDPTKATPELGEELVAIAYHRAISFARRFARQALPRGGDDGR